MDKQEAIEYIKANYPDNHRYEGLCEALDIAIKCIEHCIEEEKNPCFECYKDNCDNCMHSGRLYNE